MKKTAKSSTKKTGQKTGTIRDLFIEDMIKQHALEMDRLALEGITPICRIVVNITSIRVYLYGQLFVMIRRELFAGFSSWISGGDKYCAAFYLKQGQPIEVEMDSREKFDALLAEVDKVLGKE